MLDSGVVAGPGQLEILARAVSDYCANHKITHIDEREQVALKVMSLYRRGIVDADRLSAELEKVGWRLPNMLLPGRTGDAG